MKRVYLFAFLSLFFLSGLRAQTTGSRSKVIMVCFAKGYGNFDFYINGYQAFNIEPGSVVNYTHFVQGEIEIQVKEPISELMAGDFLIESGKDDTLFFEIVSKIPGGVDGFVYKRTSQDIWKSISEFGQKKKKKKKGELFWMSVTEVPKKEVTTNNDNAPKFGNGFLVPEGNYIVTSSKLVANAKKISIKGINGFKNTSFLAKILTTDTATGIALLQLIDSFPIAAAPYTIYPTELKGGDFIYTMGYEQVGAGITMREGVIDSNNLSTSKENSYRLLLSINKSFFGAPLLDKTGNLVGIITMGESSPTAIKGNYIKDMLAKSGVKHTLKPASELNGKPLGDQGKVLEKFVYLIEVE